MTRLAAAALAAVVAPAPASPPAVVAVEPARVQLAPGESVEVALSFSIAKGFRIQANPASRPFLVPALLELEGNGQVGVGKPVYPPGKDYRLAGDDDNLSVYEEKFLVRLPVTAGADALAGETTLTGRLRYQACNERVCLRPTSVPVAVRVTLRRD